MRPPHLISTLFPYTTLFRSRYQERRDAACEPGGHRARPLHAARKHGAAERAAGAAAGSISPMLSSCVKRSEEHTSELQSHVNLVCRLLLEKKKNVDHHRFVQ